jgi:hypothetical protein
MDRIAELHDIMKLKGGPIALAKHICETGAHGITEAEFTSALTKHAAEQHPELRPNAAFTKIYEGSIEIRRAYAVLKAAPFVANSTPLQVGGADTRDLGDESEAIAQLKQIGRDRWPTASEAQQFANAMTDPKNAALAQKAHRRPSPTTSFEFPR